MSKVTTTKGTKFVETNLKALNKTEKESQKETLEAFVEDAIIECKSAIATLETSVLPKAKLDLERANNKLNKAKKSFEEKKLQAAPNFEIYLENRESAEDKVFTEQENVASVQREVEEAERQLAKYQDVLADLTA